MEDKFLIKLKELNYPFPISNQTLCLENARLNDKYIIFDLIAVGSHSAIYYGIQEATGQERAFKVYNLKEIEINRSFKEKELCKRISNYQYQIMNKCNSVHLIKCYDIYESRDYKVIVYAYCNMGSLSAELQKRKSKFINQTKAVMIIKHIISALKTIHQSTHKFHKHVTPKNILIKNGIYKIIDFGLPVSYSEDEDDNSLLIPEIIMKKNYDQKAEVWNIGVLFHQILYGQLPYALTHQATKSHLISASVRTIFKQKAGPYSQNAINFLSNCLATNPEQRMAWAQLQKHPLLAISNQAIKFCSTPTPKGRYKLKHSSRLSLILPIEYGSQIESNSQAQKIYNNKYMFEIQKRQIQKQLQKSYIKLGDNLQFSKIEPMSWKGLREQINTDQYKSYRLLQSYYLQCLKVDFFYYQVITLLREIPSFLESRKNLEFLFLVLSRCFFQISQINMLKQTKFKDQENILFYCIKKQTQKLYQQVKNSWLSFSQRLQKQQNKWLSIISDRLSKIKNSAQYQKKQLILTGIEGEDYKKEEQISFTICFYSEGEIEKELMLKLNEMIGNRQDQAQNNSIRLILKYMKVYVNIWNMTQQENSYSNIKEYIDQELIYQEK